MFNPVMPAKVAKDLHCCHPEWWGVQDFQAEIIIFSSGIDPNFKSLGPQISGCKFIYSIYVYNIYIYIIYYILTHSSVYNLPNMTWPLSIYQNHSRSHAIPWITQQTNRVPSTNHISNPYGGFLKWVHPKPSKTMQPLESCNHGEERSGCQFTMWSCAGVLERSNFCA